MSAHGWRNLALAALLVSGAAHAQAPASDEIKRLFERAVSGEPLASIEAQDEILEFGPHAVPVLLEALKDASAKKRFFACEFLGEIRDLRAIQPLEDLLKDSGEEGTGKSVASAAAYALGRLGAPRSISKLLAALDATDVDLRYEAVRSLGILRAAEAAGKLHEMLKKSLEDPSKELDQTFHQQHLVCAVAEALGRLGVKEAEGELGKLLENDRAEPATERLVAWYAARALERVTGEERGKLNGDEKERKEAVDKWRSWWKEKTQPKKEEPAQPSGGVETPSPDSGAAQSPGATTGQQAPQGDRTPLPSPAQGQ